MKMIPVRVPVAVAREPVAAAVRVEEPAEGPGADQGEAGAENSQAHLFAANQMI